MQLKALVQGLNGIIPGGISVQDFVAVTKNDSQTCRQILEDLEKNGIGKKNGEIYDFSKGDKLKSAIYALKKGAPMEEVSENIDWRDFEGLVSEILEEKNFGTIRNLVLTKPRMEIDVVGIKLGVAMLIDCKHWTRCNVSVLQNVVQKQVQRTKHYVEKTQNAIAVPVIVTLYQEKIDFIERVPIVPILQFASFVDEFYGNLEELKTIKSN